jgi:hypothetical protein
MANLFGLKPLAASPLAGTLRGGSSQFDDLALPGVSVGTVVTDLNNRPALKVGEFHSPGVLFWIGIRFD